MICSNCGYVGHSQGARFCVMCGSPIRPLTQIPARPVGDAPISDKPGFALTQEELDERLRMLGDKSKAEPPERPPSAMCYAPIMGAR